MNCPLSQPEKTRYLFDEKMRKQWKVRFYCLLNNLRIPSVFMRIADMLNVGDHRTYVLVKEQA